MAGTDVIADAGKTLRKILTDTVSVNVVISAPDDFKTLQPPALTIFLYHVGINAELRNGPPRHSGDSISRPVLPLDLRYLITPWLNDASSAHAVVGSVVQALYDRATMGPSALEGDSWEPNDSVQVVLESLPVNEHYSIWEPTDMPYRLSLTYLVRIMGLAPGEATSVAPIVSAEFGGP